MISNYVSFGEWSGGELCIFVEGTRVKVAGKSKHFSQKFDTECEKEGYHETRDLANLIFSNNKIEKLNLTARAMSYFF